MKLADRLNEVLGVEWACVRALRRAEPLCTDPALREVVKRIRKECSLHCVTLANAVRALGGHPTDIPNPRFALKLREETLNEVLDLAVSAMTHIVAELSALLDEPDLKPVRAPLVQVRQRHQEDLRWLQAVRDTAR